MEAGVPVAATVDGDGQVFAGVLPAGRYAVLTNVGHPRELGIRTQIGTPRRRWPCAAAPSYAPHIWGPSVDLARLPSPYAAPIASVSSEPTLTSSIEVDSASLGIVGVCLNGGRTCTRSLGREADRRRLR
jgi:hypothetical protein